jgi:hypothetical protein
MRLKSMAAFHASVAGAASALALAATSGSLTAAEAQKSLARWAPGIICRRTAAARRVVELAAAGRDARTRAPTAAAREAAGSRALM